MPNESLLKTPHRLNHPGSREKRKWISSSSEKRVFSNTVPVSFPRVIWREGISTEKMLLFRQVWRHFLDSGLMWEGTAYCGQCHSLAVVTGCVRKQAERAVGRQQSAELLLGLCLSSCFQVPCLEFLPGLPFMMEGKVHAVKWNKHFPPHGAFDLVLVFTAATETKLV